MPSAQRTANGEGPRRAVLPLLVTTAVAIALAVFKDRADPFGLATDMERLSANVFNTINSPLYGKQWSINLDGANHRSRYGQSNIVILLIDEAFVREVGPDWPIDLRHYRRMLRKLVDAGAKVVFIDVFFVANRPGRDKQIASLYEYAKGLVQASRCGAESCADTKFGMGTEILFASTFQNPESAVTIDEHGGEIVVSPPATALAQIASEPTAYDLWQQVGPNDYDTAAWAIYKAWCRRTRECDTSALDEPTPDPMYLHWGYAPNQIMTEEQTLGGDVCQKQAATLLRRVAQSTRVFARNMLRGFYAQDSPGSGPADAELQSGLCPYTSQIKLQLFNHLTEGDLKALFADNVVLIGTHLEYYPDYHWSPVHGHVPGVFWHAMAVDNLIEFGGGYVRAEPGELNRYLEAASLTVLFVLQALLTWFVLRREDGDGPGTVADARLDLLHGLMIICVISAMVLWIAGMKRGAPGNWVGLAILLFFINQRPILALPRACWNALPTSVIEPPALRLVISLVLWLVYVVLLLFAAYALFTLPHALLLAGELDRETINYTFLGVYVAIIAFCIWKITLRSLR